MGKKVLVGLMGLCFLMMAVFAWAGAEETAKEQAAQIAAAAANEAEKTVAQQGTVAPKEKAVEAAVPGKAYFDEQFNGLQRSVAEVKGDTSQTLAIIGNIFEGTVPKGGNITRLCNDNGWNMIVLMGHNGIANPNKVAAGACYTYPKTTEEFQSALRKGKPLYDAWLKTQPKTFRVNRIKADTVDIDRLNVRVANFKERLAIKDMEIDQLKIRTAEITEKLKIKKAEVDELNVRVANFDQMNINKLRVKDAKIENLEIENLRIKNALIDKLRIKQLEIDNLADLLKQAQVRCQQLEARPPKTVTVVKRVPVPVTRTHGFVSNEDCGEPYFPKSWEKPIIREMVNDGNAPVYWYVNLQPCTDTDEGGWLKLKVDTFDQETRTSYTVHCERYLKNPEAACEILRKAGFEIGPGRKVKDGGDYKTLYAGKVFNWPEWIVLKR